MEFSSSRLRELNGRSLQIEPRVGKFRVSSDSLPIRFFFPLTTKLRILGGRAKQWELDSKSPLFTPELSTKR